MVRTTVTTIAMRATPVITSATKTRRRVSLGGIRTGSYIPDTPWPQAGVAPPRRGHDRAVVVGHPNHPNDHPAASPAPRVRPRATRVSRRRGSAELVAAVGTAPAARRGSVARDTPRDRFVTGGQACHPPAPAPVRPARE